MADLAYGLWVSARVFAPPVVTAARRRDAAVDLDAVFPPHDPGPWPGGLSLRREDLVDDRGGMTAAEPQRRQ